MSRLLWSILLFSLVGISLSTPLHPATQDAEKIDRYNPVRRLLDALCTGFETSFCRGDAAPAIINHILPEVGGPSVDSRIILKSNADIA